MNGGIADTQGVATAARPAPPHRWKACQVGAGAAGREVRPCGVTGAAGSSSAAAAATHPPHHAATPARRVAACCDAHSLNRGT